MIGWFRLGVASMTIPIFRVGSGLRLASNILALGLLVWAADWLWAWSTGRPGFLCPIAQQLPTEALITLIGVTGLLAALFGSALAGIRHPMSVFGFGMLTAGLIGTVVFSEILNDVCPVPLSRASQAVLIQSPG